MSGTMLTSRFDLRFTATGELVEDVEALARGVLGAEGWPRFLEPADNDELLATLLGDAVVLEGRYAPFDDAGNRIVGIEARPWLFQRLRFKARDWREVAEKHRTLPDLPSIFDDPAVSGSGEAGGLARRSGDGDRVDDRAPGTVAGDRGDSGLDALRGLLEAGDRGLLREVEALGLGAPHRARNGANGADRIARRRLTRAAA